MAAISTVFTLALALAAQLLGETETDLGIPIPSNLAML
jgi:hypothetical protein